MHRLAHATAVALLAALVCAAIADAKRSGLPPLRVDTVSHKPAGSDEQVPFKAGDVVECDRKSVVGDALEVHYSGRLQNGMEFDSSRKPGRGPFIVTLGKGQVIKGWEQGLLGMCPGESRMLTIPPHLGYGERGAPPTIPGDATLIFDVELLRFADETIPSVWDAVSVDRLLAQWHVVLMCAFLLYMALRIYRKSVQEDEEELRSAGAGTGGGEQTSKKGKRGKKAAKKLR